MHTVPAASNVQPTRPRPVRAVFRATQVSWVGLARLAQVPVYTYMHHLPWHFPRLHREARRGRSDTLARVYDQAPLMVQDCCM